MSSGDIDDRLGDAEELANLRQNDKEFDAYLTEAYQLLAVRTFFIPYAAGISQDGRRVYISHDIRAVINDVDCDNAMVRHETTEWALRQYCGIGIVYADDPSGHRLANRAEHDRVLAILDRPDAWELYESIVDPQVILAERTNLKDKPVPLDLDLYPYEDDERLLEAIREAQLNERSEEEWKKLMSR